MTKNILIFVDGTGNEGELLPDESRTKVYKLFCATRTGPGSIIDPTSRWPFTSLVSTCPNSSTSAVRSAFCSGDLSEKATCEAD
jgi:hypothetical protein